MTSTRYGRGGDGELIHSDISCKFIVTIYIDIYTVEVGSGNERFNFNLAQDYDIYFKLT